jgi:Amt family ammonium transporter
MTAVYAKVNLTVADVNTGDTAWMMISAALVMFMTPGLAQFYGGMVRAKNTVSTMMLSAINMGMFSFFEVVVLISNSHDHCALVCFWVYFVFWGW